MSNEFKSRVILWIFILGLCLASFLCGRVARADTYSTKGIDQFTFELPHGTQFTTGEYFDFPVGWLGGTIESSLYILDSSDGLLSLGSIISYPADFVADPNVAYNAQWPYSPWDYMPENVDLAHPLATQQASLAITTPEPPTGILVLIVGLVVVLKRLLW